MHNDAPYKSFKDVMPLPLHNIEIRITAEGGPLARSQSGKGGNIRITAPHLNLIFVDNGVP